MKNLGQYHYFYVQSDALLLPDVMKIFAASALNI